jgi:DNA-binding CsgD family transcriptional regulator
MTAAATSRMGEQASLREVVRTGAPLLERAAETAAIAEALGAARSGEGALLLALGEAGIGKTSLLELAGGAAREAGMTVLSARGTELERDFGWVVARQLFERWLLDQPKRERERVLGGPAEPAAEALGLARSGRDHELFAAVHGLYWVVVNAAEKAPLALLVDDLQWADEASLGWLSYLAGRMRELPIAVIGAVRRPDPSAEREPLQRLAAEPLARLLTLRPLSAAAARELIGARPLLAADDSALTDACHQASGGNPFLLGALLDDLSELATGARPDPSSVRALQPEEITRSVLLRLGRLPADARALANAFAILGASATTARAADLCGMSTARAAEAASALVAAGILADSSPPTFVHPVVHSVVSGDMPAPSRAEWHSRAAQIIEGAGGSRQEMATQLLQTEPAARSEVVDALCDAARLALAEGAPHSAAALLRRAAVEPPSTEATSDVNRLLGRALIRAEGAVGIDPLRTAVATAGDPRARAEAALELARTLESLSRNAEAVAVYEEALHDVPEDLRSTIEAGLAVSAAQQLSTLPKALELFGRALSGEDAALAAEPLMRAATGLGLTAAGLRDGVELAAAALEEPALLAADSIAVALALSAVTWGDRFELALGVWDEVVERARTRGAPLRYAFAVTFRAEVYLRLGRLADAEADARAALAVPEEMWATAVPVDTPALLADVLTERGALEEADGLLADAGPAAELSDYQGNDPLLMARAKLRLAQNRSTEAAEDLFELGRRCDAFTLRNPAALPWRSHAALAIHREDPERAKQLAAEEVEIATAFGAPRALGIALRAEGLVRQDVGRLASAVEVLRGSEAKLELARALVDLGAAQRRGHERTKAREHLSEGLDIAAVCRAAPLAERARAELVAAGARPRRDRITGRDALTASELRVAKLATEGKTNREIAEALWVTLSTVEAHLTRVYRKLDISRRSDLAEALKSMG